ncbi:DNA gyrase subunit B [Streptomyces sp. NPDC101160]|uniref:DNA gyrase subunit B n=1 Tax=Streptomyces sp. NPDC101160 TaxID=3366118 RepID=UPI003815E9E4
MRIPSDFGAVNEVVAGRAGSVAVTLLTDGGVRVADDADTDGESDGRDLEALLTTFYAGARPRGRHDVPVSLFGVGPFVTNALASHLRAEVRRGGTRWVQEYARGVALAPPAAAGPASGSGTEITFRPDPEIFETVEFSYDALGERLRELAFLNRELDITLTDERDPGGALRSERLRYPAGARDFVAFLGGRAGAQPGIIGFERDDPRMAGTVEVALRWSDSPEEQIRSFANSRPTPQGGTHEEGFRDGMTAAVGAYAREQRLIGPADPGPGAAHVGVGLTAVVSVKLDAPEFHGATHGALGGTAVRDRVAETVREELGAWLGRHPEQAAAVVGRIVRAARQG